MSSLIEIDKLIRQAKRAGVDLGKGDPYNRLRYYTKIGWLPHMDRKKTKSGEVKGHYPTWALERLVQIDKLKDQGMDNDAITSKITTRNKLHDMYAKVNTEKFRSKMISYLTMLILGLILLNETDIISLSKSKNQDIRSYSETNVPPYIVKAGTGFVPANRNVVFVKESEISSNSKVYVTFNQNFSPASRFWVSKIDTQKGFYVELDAPVFDNVEFNWWISK